MDEEIVNKKPPAIYYVGFGLAVVCIGLRVFADLDLNASLFLSFLAFLSGNIGALFILWRFKPVHRIVAVLSLICFVIIPALLLAHAVGWSLTGESSFKSQRAWTFGLSACIVLALIHVGFGKLFGLIGISR